MFTKAIITFIGFTALAFPNAVLGAEPQCLDCHPDKKENKVVHPAVEMGCNSCHAGTHMGEKPAPKLNAAMPDLCFGCHDQGKFSAKVQHAPVAGGMCTSCHNPHASAQPKLLSAAVPDLCLTCHDAAMMKKKVVHPPVKDGQCTFCHAHHGSDHPAILTGPQADLCTSCHDKQSSGKHVMAGFDAVDTHPLKGRPDPSRPGRELTCVSCHDPHASERKRLFTGGGEGFGSICLKCHTKIKAGP
jgi:predicted CXXCH cytochrome family protein